ncbi:MAG: N-acetylmuramoyl-L-alanine amidase [Thermoanaerobaculia bacterium]|nr:N-acetylmuramoyl-L-alanine amidase [Thermoanaerobaculia bacterium]
MRDAERLKRQMLRDAVRENLDTIEGRPPARFRPGGRWARRAVRGAALVAIPLALFASINAFSGGGVSPTEVVVVPQRTVAPSPEPGLETLAWPAPKSIDPTLFHLDVRTIVLDAGHGGVDPGALTADGLAEKDVTLDVARRVREKLRGGLFRVVMTREGDETISLRERSRRARDAGGDVLVSIHVNSIPRPDRRGVETYYLGPTDDPAIRRLASAENRSSGYSLSDFRGLLEEVYVGVRQAESRRLAESVQAELVASTQKVTPEAGDRGVKSAPFVVLIASEMPGILAEVSSVSHAEDARLLRDEAYREAIAEALARGVRAYADARNLADAGRSGNG